MLGGSKRFILVAIFTAILIVFVNVAWWYYYQRTEDMLDRQLSRRLGSIAELSSQVIDPGDLMLIELGDIDIYLDVADQLEQIRRVDSLSEVFLIDQNYRYLATTLLTGDTIYFLASLHAPVIDSMFFGEISRVAITPAYHSGDLSLRSAFAPVADDAGLVVAVLGVEANIDYADALTELRQNLYYATALSLLIGLLLGLVFLWLQRRINQAEQRLFLGETHAHLGRMVAVVAHELRNPLMIIRASAERIRKKTDMAEAEFVTEEVDRLNDIVTGYLDFAKSGGSLLASDHAEPIRLNELVTNLRKHLTDKFRDEQIEWIGDQSDDCTFDGYPRSLRQVLLNLLINGVESCREAGKPIVVGLESHVLDSEIELRVIDRGRGLGRKELKKIFTPFYTTRQAGSGLGL
ncbi:hypothetical protein GF377_05665 [candidate division GN15 bacterium]|nr:hypothetical protein [candidate division GN15 bacterium]